MSRRTSHVRAASDARIRTRDGAPVGFTLLEVLLALMLTAIAVGLASAALRTASSARDRVLAHRANQERESRLRATLTDMLRHAPSAEAVNEPLMRIALSPDGGAQLVFLSHGVRAPYGTGGIWRVTLQAIGDSLVLDAEPVGVTPDGTRLHSVLPDVSMLRVQVLEPTRGNERARWRTDWPLERARPTLIALDFGAEGTRAPLVVALDPFASALRGTVAAAAPRMVRP